MRDESREGRRELLNLKFCACWRSARWSCFTLNARLESRRDASQISDAAAIRKRFEKRSDLAWVSIGLE